MLQIVRLKLKELVTQNKGNQYAKMLNFQKRNNCLNNGTALLMFSNYLIFLIILTSYNY